MKPHPSKTAAKATIAQYRAVLARANRPDASEADQAAFWSHKSAEIVARFAALLASKEPGSREYYAIAARAETGPGWVRAGRN